MKRLLFLLGVAAILTVSGCGAKGQPSVAQPQPPVQSAAQALEGSSASTAANTAPAQAAQDTTKLGEAVAMPEPGVSKPGEAAAMPEPGVSKLGEAAAMPEPGASKPSEAAAMPEPGVSKPGEAAAMPEPSASKPANPPEAGSAANQAAAALSAPVDIDAPSQRGSAAPSPQGSAALSPQGSTSAADAARSTTAPGVSTEQTQPASAATPEKIALKISITGDKKRGVILNEMSVPFKEGTTVMDVLKQVTKENKLQMEFKGTGTYAYVQGIDNLYEFDEGPKSGWIYKINGGAPAVGAGSTKVKAGDKIEWLYTLNLGADVGAKMK